MPVVVIVELDAGMELKWKPVAIVIIYVQGHVKNSAQIAVVQIALDKQMIMIQLFIIAGFKIFKIINKKIGYVLIYIPYFFIFLNIILVINIISLYAVEIIITTKSKLIIIH